MAEANVSGASGPMSAIRGLNGSLSVPVLLIIMLTFDIVGLSAGSS
jgi:hypothetical protein